MISSPRSMYKLAIGRSTNQYRITIIKILVTFVEFSYFGWTNKGEVLWPPKHNHPLTGVLNFFIAQVIELFSFFIRHDCFFLKLRKLRPERQRYISHIVYSYFFEAQISGED